jgi:hypothetical protein
LHDLKTIAKDKALTLGDKAILLVKRLLILVVLLVLFGASGYGIYELNKYSARVRVFSFAAVSNLLIVELG